MYAINEAAAAYNLTIISGGAATVGFGGYISGGGHSATSHLHGLAADNVLEMTVVTPSGELIAANECVNTELFWALRGGGGGTFGVMVSVTVRTFPSFRYAVVKTLLATSAGEFNADAFWDKITEFTTRLPDLTDSGVSAYIQTATGLNGAYFGLPFSLNGCMGTFQLPLLHVSNSTASLVGLVDGLMDSSELAGKAENGTTWLSSLSPAEYADFFTYWKDNNGTESSGINAVLALRLLDKKVLTFDRVKLKKALILAGESSGFINNLVSGLGVHRFPAYSNSVNPAWRTTYVHAMMGAYFAPFQPIEQKRKRQQLRDVCLQGLKELSDDGLGSSYVN